MVDLLNIHHACCTCADSTRIPVQSEVERWPPCVSFAYVELVRNVCIAGANSAVRKLATIGTLVADALDVLHSMPSSALRGGLAVGGGQTGKESGQTGKERGQTGKESGQRGKEGGQGGKEGGQAGKECGPGEKGEGCQGEKEGDKEGVEWSARFSDGVQNISGTCGFAINDSRFNGSLFSLLVLRQLETGVHLSS